MNKKQFVERMKEVLPPNGEEREVFINEFEDCGILINGDIKIFDTSEEGTFENGVSKFFYYPGSFDCWDFTSKPREQEVPEGYVYFQFGSPATGYASIFKKNPSIEDVCESYIEERIKITLDKTREIMDCKTSEKKSYGHQINDRLKSAGADKDIINAYWSLGWRKETTPEEFVGFCRDIDKTRLRLALCAESKRVLWRLFGEESPLYRKSFPRTMDLLQGIARALGVEKDWSAFRRFMNNVD